MTTEQRERIGSLRQEGYGYTAIAKAIGLTKDGVKAYCRAHGLAGVKARSNARVAPEQEFFAEVQEPLDVEMVAEQTAVPAPDAVRSLDSVQRKTITEAGPDLAAADLKSPQAQAFAGLAAEPVLTSATPAQAPAPPPPPCG